MINISPWLRIQKRRFDISLFFGLFLYIRNFYDYVRMDKVRSKAHRKFILGLNVRISIRVKWLDFRLTNCITFGLKMKNIKKFELLNIRILKFVTQIIYLLTPLHTLGELSSLLLLSTRKFSFIIIIIFFYFETSIKVISKHHFSSFCLRFCLDSGAHDIVRTKVHRKLILAARQLHSQKDNLIRFGIFSLWIKIYKISKKSNP